MDADGSEQIRISTRHVRFGYPDTQENSDLIGESEIRISDDRGYSITWIIGSPRHQQLEVIVPEENSLFLTIWKTVGSKNDIDCWSSCHSKRQPISSRLALFWKNISLCFLKIKYFYLHISWISFPGNKKCITVTKCITEKDFCGNTIMIQICRSSFYFKDEINFLI